MVNKGRLRYGRLLIAILAGLLVMAGGWFLFSDLQTGEKKGADVPWEDADFRYFQQQQPQAAVFCWGRGDLNNDGVPETVIIYGLPKKETRSSEAVRNKGEVLLDSQRWMTLVQEVSGAYCQSAPVRAPVSNQTIEFKDIDNKAPLEVIISGSKGSNTGYAVYRLIEGKMVDLFGEGMDRCC
ncbi:MAG: Cys-Cys-COOH (seleno)protein SaoC [Syntrophomonas sp.]